MAFVVLLEGGTSPEREISLRSAAEVAKALTNKGHTVRNLDTSRPLNAYKDILFKADVVFPVLHGIGGEDGTIQNYLEDLRIPFVGSGSRASMLCFDKYKYTKHIAKKGLPTAKSSLVTLNDLWTNKLVKAPFVLKPFDGGSSIDTFLIRDPQLVNYELINDVFTRHKQMLLEQLITGNEITVGVLNSHALPVIEIIPPVDGEFDFTNKYNGTTQELCPPIHISSKIQSEAQRLAELAHNYCDCQDISRTDMMVDTQGNLFILETNTIPGMTAQSLFPKAAKVAGIDMIDLCDQLVQQAMAR